MDFNIVAVTACVSGGAHPWLPNGWKRSVIMKMAPKVETQGALALKIALPQKISPRAEVVLLVTDIEIDDAQSALSGLRTIKTSIRALPQPQQIVEAVKAS